MSSNASLIAFNKVLLMHSISVKYHGKACHASAYPWDGVNALDAAVLAYNKTSVLRQQLRLEDSRSVWGGGNVF